MRKARQITVRDGHAVYGMGQMAKARAEDQAKFDGFLARDGLNGLQKV